LNELVAATEGQKYRELQVAGAIARADVRNAPAHSLSSCMSNQLTIKPATHMPRPRKLFSKDGTAIAFDRIGDGPPVILIDGALCYRAFGSSRPLAKLLAQHFTVFTYDRRGRGDSGDTAPYAVEREVEDIEALVNEAGGAAFTWGISSGAVLALEATNRLTGIKKVAVYEAPFIVDDSHPATKDNWVRINQAVAANRRNDAVKFFLKLVGLPAFFIALMRLMPVWSKLKAVAHTIPYDGAIVQDNQRGKPLPVDRWTSVTVPTLVMDGGKSPGWIRQANRSLANVLPNAKHCTLEGQTHMVKAEALAPTLVDFFKD